MSIHQTADHRVYLIISLSRALSVKFFSFSQSKKNVHDENMNSLTLAGETSPPKSNDKRLVHTYLLMSVLLLIKSVFESKLLSSFIG